MQKHKQKFLLINLAAILLLSCHTEQQPEKASSTSLPTNTLNYIGTPTAPEDRNSLMFSDRGAWFAYGFPDKENITLGFSGPFLMTQGFGEWSSKSLSQLSLTDSQTKQEINLEDFSITQTSYLSHLEQSFENENWKIIQTLFYSSPHSCKLLK